MDETNNDGNHTQSQQPSRQKRRPRAKKAEKKKDAPDPIGRLVAKGWTTEDNISANKVFLPGRMLVKGRLHATDKLCLRGDYVVGSRLECEGTFTLFGSLSCWDKPAVVKNMVVINHGTIHGDVVVTAGAYIKGKCTINGKLTVRGTVRICGTLKCKSFDLAGSLEKLGLRSQLIIEGHSVINRVDTLEVQLVRLLREFNEQHQEQAPSSH
ncbi:hypothetical protein F5Y10DRAFT_266881 [Nemania abortiva]|nr:hypothetical protein F5Y10DRAFT_266881 [Nemania abortiva]